jgi:hypothetical protein
MVALTARISGFQLSLSVRAVADINRRTPRVSVRSYLDDFRESERRKGNLLNSDFGDLRRDEGVSNSVVVTWQITLGQTRQENRPQRTCIH